MLADIIGSIAATLTTVAFVPQVLHVLKTKNTEAISFAMYLVFCCGVAMWLVYGLMIGSWPIIIANSVTIGLAGTVLVMKWRSLAR